MKLLKMDWKKNTKTKLSLNKYLFEVDMLVLASASPRRKELLEKTGLRFEIIVSDIEEKITKSAPDEMVKSLARQKAMAVYEKLAPDRVVIGADTIVEAGGKVLGKPADADEAFKMLRMLSGKQHSVYTGVSVISGGIDISFAERTKVTFYELTDEEIKGYTATGEPLDKAGAYGIQGRGALLVKKIEGDYNNVVGLPIARLYRSLSRLALI